MLTDSDTLFTESAKPAATVPRFGRLTPVVVTVAVVLLSVLSWWLLADPKWSPIGASLPAVNAVLFWTILAFIFTGFTFDNWPFSKLGQPLSGFLQIATNVAIGFATTWLFTFVGGSWDPTFSHAAAGGTGFTATAFVVLVGFYAYAFAASSWEGYPFEKIPGPVAGVAQWFLAAFIMLVGVVVLIYPNFNAALSKAPPLALPAATGWVYSSTVLVIVGAMIWQNWPWALVKNRHGRAAAALVVTLGGGIGLYYALRPLVQAPTPAGIKALPSFSVATQTAELGVCIVMWGSGRGTDLRAQQAQAEHSRDPRHPHGRRGGPGHRHLRRVHAFLCHHGAALPGRQGRLWRLATHVDQLDGPNRAVVQRRSRRVLVNQAAALASACLQA